jgi:hypothetical protein
LARCFFPTKEERRVFVALPRAADGTSVNTSRAVRLALWGTAGYFAEQPMFIRIDMTRDELSLALQAVGMYDDDQHDMGADEGWGFDVIAAALKTLEDMAPQSPPTKRTIPITSFLVADAVAAQTADRRSTLRSDGM